MAAEALVEATVGFAVDRMEREEEQEPALSDSDDSPSNPDAAALRWNMVREAVHTGKGIGTQNLRSHEQEGKHTETEKIQQPLRKESEGKRKQSGEATSAVLPLSWLLQVKGTCQNNILL